MEWYRVENGAVGLALCLSTSPLGLSSELRGKRKYSERDSFKAQTLLRKRMLDPRVWKPAVDDTV
jgi:hypothetical protein